HTRFSRDWSSDVCSSDLRGSGGVDAWCLLRAVDPPPPPLPRRHHLVLARGPFTTDGERALLREHRIEALVARDSGGELTAAKLVAARELGLPVVLIDRPPAPPAPSVTSVPEALEWLAATLAAGR